MKRALVRVRMLKAVTYGTGPEWPPDSVQLVPAPLADMLVKEGEAEYARRVVDTTVALGAVPQRTRGL